MDLNAHTKTVSDILSVKSKYVIPRYQREYSWEKEHVDELWSDVVHNIEIKDNVIKHNEYFIGALVLVGEDGTSKYDVVDGQQRLTTLTIFLSVLVHRFIEISEESLAEAIYENYISGKDKKGKQYFKLENESPRPYLQTAIQHLQKDAHAKASTQEEKLLKKAYDRIFKLTDQLELAKRKWPGEYVDWLEALRDQIVDFLKVIFITVNDEAYTVFETLNARGVNLTFVDLIKTKIFKDLNGTHPVDYAKDRWRAVRSSISSVDGGGMEQFMRHFWISEFSYSSAGKIYSEFVQRWKSGAIEAEALLEKIANNSKLYVQIISPTPSEWTSKEEKKIAKSFQAFTVFGVSQQRSFLLSLLDARNRNVVRPSLVVKMVHQMECFHFQFNAICSKRPSGLEGTYSRAARDLRRCSSPLDARRILDKLVKQLQDRLPSKQDFIEGFLQLEYSDSNTRRKPLIQYVLKEFESAEGSGEKVISDLSIEHIAPQSDGNEGVQKIGNLLAIGSSLNSKAGNLSVNEKVKIYAKSEFLVAQKFAKEFLSNAAKPNEWTSDSIASRSRELACMGYDKVWKFDW